MHLRLELNKPSAFSKETETTIVDLLRKTRTPFPRGTAPAGEETTNVEAEAQALENTLRSFQKELVEREKAIRAKELSLTEMEQAVMRRATELAQDRALLEKQRQLYESGLRSDSASASPEAAKMMEELQVKLDEQSRTIEESKEWLRERETFLEESEATLFDKMQKQQEREMELEQKAENLKKLESKVGEIIEKLRARGEAV